MTRPKSSNDFFGKPPAFAWRAALILLPVVVLAMTGVLFLQRDAAFGLAEARRQSEELLNELKSLVRIPLELHVQTNPVPSFLLLIATNSVPFELDSEAKSGPSDDWMFKFEQQHGLSLRVHLRHGALRYPPFYDPVPHPRALPWQVLSGDQRQQWLSMEAVDQETADTDARIDACRRFLAQDPPQPFAALAQERLAQLLLSSPDSRIEACSLLDTLAASTNKVRTESGLPLETLARFRLLHLGLNSPGSPVQDRVPLDFLAQVIAEPSALTPVIIEEISRAISNNSQGPSELKLLEDWHRVWRGHEQARWLNDALGTRSMAWLKREQEWLAYRLRRGAGELVVGVPTDTLQKTAHTLSQQLGSRANVWEADLAFAGRSFLIPTQAAPSSVTASPIRQSWSVDLDDATSSSPLVSLGVRLAHPEAYFAQYRQRRLWFAWLIGISAIGAIVGLWSTWQAFQRQVRLAAMKSDFVSSVSHELRAPLAAIQLLVDSLERGVIQDESRRKQYHGLIGRECRRLATLIGNVLDFSRIERHRLNFEFEPTDVLLLVKDTVAVLTPHAEELQIQLNLKTGESAISDRRVEAICDGKAIQQALVNLIDNALKHSPAQGTVTVGMGIGDVAIGPMAEAGGCMRTEANQEASSGPARLAEASSPYPTNKADHWLRLWVDDEGPGIPAEDHDRIFEPFFRRGSELRRETQGIGIGLSIVKHIVEAHHGRIQVQSRPGPGARFVIELPVQPPREPNRN
ncbi:MAG TPA: HAMP domain-containing sensor histidine kinase [Verrucomicrobiota bacterium]|nr:HAMP domain-containing sensor histidine kinase [Verrucomicrobiota bacterium]